MADDDRRAGRAGNSFASDWLEGKAISPVLLLTGIRSTAGKAVAALDVREDWAQIGVASRNGDDKYSTPPHILQ